MLLDLQRLLVAALRTPDPAGFLRERAEREPGLRADERRALLAAGEDGLRMSRVMIRKLRLRAKRARRSSRRTRRASRRRRPRRTARSSRKTRNTRRRDFCF